MQTLFYVGFNEKIIAVISASPSPSCAIICSYYTVWSQSICQGAEWVHNKKINSSLFFDLIICVFL